MSSSNPTYTFMESKVALRSAVLCDDVRREASGKVTLVGCYGSGIRFRKRPSIVQAKIHCVFQIMDDSIEKFSIQIETPAAFESQEINKNEFPNPEKPFEIIIPVTSMVEEVDKLILSYSIEEGIWVKILEWSLTFRDDAVDLTEDEIKTLRIMYALKEGKVMPGHANPIGSSESEFSNKDTPE